MVAVGHVRGNRLYNVFSGQQIAGNMGRRARFTICLGHLDHCKRVLGVAARSRGFMVGLHSELC